MSKFTVEIMLGGDGTERAVGGVEEWAHLGDGACYIIMAFQLKLFNRVQISSNKNNTAKTKQQQQKVYAMYACTIDTGSYFSLSLVIIVSLYSEVFRS